MPRAVIGREFGPPETYRLEIHDPGQPGPGEVRVAIRAAGVSYVDVLTAMGKYQFLPPLPFVPGSEYAGVVEALGEGVKHLGIGELVFGSAFGGIFAEVGRFRADNVKVVPDGLAVEQAAVFLSSAQTAYHALVDRGRLQSGETVLVLGAAGATGYAAIQMAKYLGARVIASASSAEKRALALKAGADAAVETGAADWREQVKAANGGKAIDVVFDPVGGELMEPAFRSLAFNGRHLVIGFTAGIGALRTNLALLKSASLVGVHVRHFSQERPAQAAHNSRKIYELAQRGLLQPAIGKVFPLEDYVAAMNEAFQGKTAGRIILKTGRDGCSPQASSGASL